MSAYYVYILASKKQRNALHRHIGVTGDLRARLELHRSGKGSEFVKKYEVMRLVYVKDCPSTQEAIQREKQLKNWHRDWKIRLIEENNPDWGDLSHLL
jgi:putative endonuclease